MVKKKNSKTLSVSINEIEMAEDKTVTLKINHKIDVPEDLCKLKDKVTGSLVLKIQNNFLMLDSTDFHAPLILKCDRCLNEYTHILDFKIDEAIEITDNPCALPEVELEYDKCFEFISSSEEIDVIDLIRQYVIINLPLKKICNPDCQGIKYSLTEEDFNDPRWASLMQIKQKLEQGEN